MRKPELSFSHVGLFVRDIARMADFYTRLLGFSVSDRGQMGKTSFVFLTRDPREHHQIAFRMGDFAGLREMYRAVQAEAGVTEIAPVSHGNALSVYFRDPEGNRIELFVDTPWYVEQPLRIPMDMSLPDAELWQWAHDSARK